MGQQQGMVQCPGRNNSKKHEKPGKRGFVTDSQLWYTTGSSGMRKDAEFLQQQKKKWECSLTWMWRS